MATDMTASGWEAAGAIVVLKQWQGWGGGYQGRQALVQMNAYATNWGGGADTYPSNGIPAPAPSLVGFRDRIDYIIPVSPFFRAGGNGGVGPVVWGCVVPTGGVSGTTPVVSPRIRVQRNNVSGSASAAAGIGIAEPPTTVAASTLFSTDVCVAYGVFVGA